VYDRNLTDSPLTALHSGTDCETHRHQQGTASNSCFALSRFPFLANSQTLKAEAKVLWNDAHAVELRFLRNAPECRSNFAAWLDSLETQLQFHQSTQPGNPG